MKRIAVLCVLCVLCGCLFFPGCGLISKDPKIELLAARHTYAGVVNTLAASRRAGAFTKERAAEITMYIDVAGQLLDDWEASLRLGEKSGPAIDNWRAVLRKLTAAQIEAERSRLPDTPAASPAAAPRAKPTPTPPAAPSGDPFNPEPAVPMGVLGGSSLVRAGRRRRATDPASVLAWMTLLLELGYLVGDLADITRRILSGESVSDEEMKAAVEACKSARKNWDDAAGGDQ